MTTEEERNLKLAKLWEALYNSDTERFANECYTSDCEVNEGLIRGQAQLLEVVNSVVAAAPKRKMRADRCHAAGSTVIIEAVLLDTGKGPDWKIPFCAVLTCRDGRVASDRTYADFTNWPGLTDF